MTNKTEFQIRILKKYGVLPIFEGDIDFKNVKSPEENETFSAWCDRVLQKDSSDVCLYGLYQPTGQKQIENLKDDGQLIALIRSYAKNKLLKKLKIAEEIKESEEFDDDDADDEFGMFLTDRPLEKVEPWYIKLKELKAPECLVCYESKDLQLLKHSEYVEYSYQYGSAARHIIVLNDIAMYAADLSQILDVSEGGFEESSLSAEDLQRYAEDSSEIGALKINLESASTLDRESIARDHVGLVISYVDGLLDAINDLDESLSFDVENLNPAEQFIASSMIKQPVDALQRCATILWEL